MRSNKLNYVNRLVDLHSDILSGSFVWNENLNKNFTFILIFSFSISSCSCATFLIVLISLGSILASSKSKSSTWFASPPFPSYSAAICDWVRSMRSKLLLVSLASSSSSTSCFCCIDSYWLKISDCFCRCLRSFRFYKAIFLRFSPRNMSMVLSLRRAALADNCSRS